MKKIIFVVLMVLSMVHFALAESRIVSQHPGISLVQDDKEDLFLVNCIQNNLDLECSFPSTETSQYAPWFDIQLAKIHQIGKDYIDFTIVTYGDIPEAPTDIAWIAYAWQFNWDCNPEISDRAGIRVYYNKNEGRWLANWYTVASCNPRIINHTFLIDDLIIEGDTISVRVPINDLFLNVGENVVPLPWFAISRRTWYVTGGYNTKPVDWAPGDIHALSNAIFELKLK